MKLSFPDEPVDPEQSWSGPCMPSTAAPRKHFLYRVLSLPIKARRSLPWSRLFAICFLGPRLLYELFGLKSGFENKTVNASQRVDVQISSNRKHLPPPGPIRGREPEPPVAADLGASQSVCPTEPSRAEPSWRTLERSTGSRTHWDSTGIYRHTSPESLNVDGLSSSAENKQSTTSKVAYFKRKYAEEEDLQGGIPGYLQKHLILQEDRSCILKLSLEKLRFLEDPEVYLRRSVLINNLLRKIHHEEEELEADDEEEEEEEGQRRTMNPDRKRVKVLVTDCCSPAFGLEDLQRYRLVPCYQYHQYHQYHQYQDRPLLLYHLDDHG
ncbi:uncharacterized protein LOC110949703 [Acanthochromis polyacanthus]|uniref:uncharacterized protein LOC110949703 n=1 Tax=Acanthochromis polyacanthus TaxID=80966 RepID=UPI0022349895|nr:uncharacterized protein LOC110949703 [Acanthochromis polyacanthus]